MESVGIRDVKKSLSRYLRKVKMGETVTITERGVPVARLSPIHGTIPDEAYEMVNEGLASWKGSRPGRVMPVPRKASNGKKLAEMVSEDRR